MTIQFGTLQIQIQTRHVVRRRNRRVRMARDLRVDSALACGLACSAVAVFVALARLGGAL